MKSSRLNHAELEELFDRIQNTSVTDHTEHGNILCQLIEQVIALERRVQDVEGTAMRAANTASCLANGIQPD